MLLVCFGTKVIMKESVHSGLPSIAGRLPDGVGVPATTYDYLRPSQFAYTSLIL
jgi:hypothetical protein